MHLKTAGQASQGECMSPVLNCNPSQITKVPNSSTVAAFDIIILLLSLFALNYCYASLAFRLMKRALRVLLILSQDLPALWNVKYLSTFPTFLIIEDHHVWFICLLDCRENDCDPDSLDVAAEHKYFPNISLT